MATHLEFYVQIYADLFTSRYYIKRIEHLLHTVQTIDHLRSLNSSFINQLNNIKATRDYMELKNQNILNDYHRNLHFASRDSQKSFKFLRKLEADIIPLQRIFKICMAVNEKGIAYQKMYTQKLNAVYKKYNHKFSLIYKNWEKYPELCNVFHKFITKLSRKGDEQQRSTKKFFRDHQASNRSQIAKLPHHYKKFIQESLQKETAMCEFCLFKIKLAVRQFKISSEENRRSCFKTNTVVNGRRINKKIDTKSKNKLGNCEKMVKFKRSKSIAALESKIVSKRINANWKFRKKVQILLFIC